MDKDDKLLIIWKNNKNKSPIWEGAKSKEELLEKVKKIKPAKEDIVVIRMDEVDLDFVNEIHDILGDNLRIAPIAYQEEKRVHDNIDQYPYYTYEEIVRKEELLESYVKIFDDYYDKDGDLKTLSPLEKFILAYIITIRFSPYKDVDDIAKQTDYHVSRSVYEFIDNDLDRRIVCVGYIKFLESLLCKSHGDDDESTIYEFECYSGKLNEYGRETGHFVAIMHLIDKKYDFEGLMLSDPTFDAHGLTSYDTKYMLMNREDAEKKYKYSDAPYVRIDDNAFKALEKKIPNARELHEVKIPPDTLIKAFLAVDHFLDKNKKMVKDNNYDSAEYCKMAEKLGFNDIAEKYAYDKLINYDLKTITKEDKNLVYTFLDGFNHRLSDDLKKMKLLVSSSLVYYDEDNNRFVLQGLILFPINKFATHDMAQKYQLSGEPDSSCALFNIKELDNRPLNEQYHEIISLCQEFSDSYKELIKDNPLGRFLCSRR
jgi:hypothetical protein